MRILNIISTLDPAYGGPVEALRNICEALREMGHHVGVVTLDSPANEWMEHFPGQVIGLGPSYGKYRFNTRLEPWLRAHHKQWDAVIVHCIYHYHSLAVWLASRRCGFPYFVFVHGALDPWFKRAYPLKHMKKWFYWPWGVYPVLKGAKAVFYTTEEERVLARRSFWLYHAGEAVVGLGIQAHGGDPDSQRDIFLEQWPQLRGKRILLFLSRIDKKKGCDLLIESFANVARKDPELHLVIAGPAGADMKASLSEFARSHSVADRITWTGMLTGDSKWGAYHAAEAFVLPSHSENFGIVIAEALAVGLPVLISNKVNIWQEIAAAGAGLVEEDSPAGTLSLLTRWLDLSKEQRQAMTVKARVCFRTNFDCRNSAVKMLDTVRLCA